MTACVTSWPRNASASWRSLRRIIAEISCGVNRLPSMLARQSVPMWRFTEEIVRSGLIAACRQAVAPTRRSPSFVKATTLGVVREPSALWMMAGLPPSTTAAQLFVVPKSIPIVAISVSFRENKVIHSSSTKVSERGTLRQPTGHERPKNP